MALNQTVPKLFGDRATQWPSFWVFTIGIRDLTQSPKVAGSICPFTNVFFKYLCHFGIFYIFRALFLVYLHFFGRHFGLTKVPFGKFFGFVSRADPSLGRAFSFYQTRFFLGTRYVLDPLRHVGRQGHPVLVGVFDQQEPSSARVFFFESARLRM